MLVCPNDTQKVPTEFVELLSDAVCYMAKWLKSSQERLSGKYTDGTDRASLGSAKGRKVRYFAPLCGLAGPRNRAHSHFPDNL